MADGMKLKVVTPTGGFYDGEVSMVELTTTEGEIGVYPNHIPLTAVVAPAFSKSMRTAARRRQHCCPDSSPFCRSRLVLWQRWLSGRMRSTLAVQKRHVPARSAALQVMKLIWMQRVRKQR